MLALMIPLGIGASLALHGQIHLDHTRRAVASTKPIVRQAGWEVKLETKGKMFFVVCILTMAPAQYTIPAGDNVGVTSGNSSKQ